MVFVLFLFFSISAGVKINVRRNYWVKCFGNCRFHFISIKTWMGKLKANQNIIFYIACKRTHCKTFYAPKLICFLGVVDKYLHDFFSQIIPKYFLCFLSYFFIMRSKYQMAATFNSFGRSETLMFFPSVFFIFSVHSFFYFNECQSRSSKAFQSAVHSLLFSFGALFFF
jgi:hypothetical protein